MSTGSPRAEASEAARIALFERILEQAAEPISPTTALRLAEAWAWLAFPDNPHGANQSD